MTMNKRAGTPGLIVAFILAFAGLPAISAPRSPASDDAQTVERMRAVIAANAGKLLETQGGSRIVFKVDTAALHEAVVTELRDDLYRILREGRIPFSGLAMRDGGVEVRIAEPKDRQRVLSKLVPSMEAAPTEAAAVAIADSGDGLSRFTPTEAGFAERLQRLVGQSIRMIEQRLRNADIRPASVQPDGSDRIRIQLPGISDPGRVAAMFAKQARLSFRLVDVSMTAEKALEGSPPEGSEVLTDFKTKAPYLVLKETAIEGGDIIDAGPGFDPATHQPIASFRFNAHGARRFAQVTQDNVGKSFAIVLDDRVLSVSVIREPILGGSGLISAGDFTLEDANTIAMMLRSGTLPGRLSVVEQQVVEPAGNAGKQQ
ncbi:preprotein translocase subunit SecD [Bradyrhizobium erythrophlei]|jgi:preprotein translocase subunit SecD|nr:preprotein translocase subunit SecD [Bradyrhizobium erythrophlei]